MVVQLLASNRGIARILGALAVAALVFDPATAQTGVAESVASEPDPIHLRIVGSLGGVNQYTRHEQPFWTQVLPALTGGRVTADIVPFDQAGLRGQEVLRLMRAGIVPFGTIVLGTNSSSEPEFGAADLAGLSPNIKAASLVVNAFRPHLKRALRERFDVELLAIYVYPAQMLFCKQPLTGLKNLAGRRIRTAQPSVSDFVKALGAIPVRTPFPDIIPNIRSGTVDCAITGSMSGNSIGLHALTTHIYSMPLTWGLSIFGANTAAWQALPVDVRTLLRAELSHLEANIWAAAERETTEGVKCDVGSPDCVSGSKGTMIEVKPTVADDQLRQQIFASDILPMWIKRCGPDCADVWNKTLKPVTGIEAVGK